MKNPPTIHKFRAPIYNAPIWVVIGPSISKSIDYVEDLISFKIHEDKDKLSTRAYTFAYIDERYRQRYILFLNPYAKPGEIAHEVKHLINILFNWHGVKLSLANDEHECYYLEYMIDKVHHYMKVHIKQKTFTTVIV